MNKPDISPTALAAALVGILGATAPLGGALASDADLKAKIERLERELAEARAKLKEAEHTLQAANDLGPKKIELLDGRLKVGGAMRVNYAIGDYGEVGQQSRAWGDGGNVELDTFRINLDYADGPLIGKLEYRFYNEDFSTGGYNFLHTGWLGYNLEGGAQVQAGVNRVPFGPGAYGVSQSFFFDQHYYLGLSDDMDLGVKYTRPMGDWTWDVAYYYSDEGSYNGSTRDSARYSYDVVNESGTGYEERNQFNLRGVYNIADDAMSTDLGFSLQYGQLESKGVQDDGDHYAASVHMVNKWDNFTLASQVTYYEYDVDPYVGAGLVQFGAYDFPNTVAAKGWVPAISLSYNHATPEIPWLDYVTPYAEYSAVLKEQSGFNDSEMVTLGAAWARGGWYIYTDLVYSNGNEFIGGDTAFGDRLGANADDEWLTRFNINFGYYF